MEKGTDPMSREKLSVDQLMQVRNDIKPRPPLDVSFPRLSKILQDEWHTSTMNRFALRQQLLSRQSELSRAFHEHDAACSVVIAGLQMEVAASKEVSEAHASVSQPREAVSFMQFCDLTIVLILLSIPDLRRKKARTLQMKKQE
ncbi:Prp19/Pso4-like protein [Trichuris suis]|nr:Prp19/Pso4-like protein [Trichuris suis]